MKTPETEPEGEVTNAHTERILKETTFSCQSTLCKVDLASGIDV